LLLIDPTNHTQLLGEQASCFVDGLNTSNISQDFSEKRYFRSSGNNDNGAAIVYILRNKTVVFQLLSTNYMNIMYTPLRRAGAKRVSLK